MNIEEMKLCIQCKEQKPLSRFYKIKGTNKYVSTCNDCKNILQQEKRSKKIVDPSVMYTCEDCHETKSCTEFKTLNVCLKCYYQREKKKYILKRNELNIIVEEKVCTDCRRMLPIKNYSKCNGHLDGYSANCKECASEYSKKYREQFHEQIVKQKREAYYSDPDRLEKGAKYREENREKIREWDRIRNRKFRSRKSERDRVYRKERRKRDPIYRAYQNVKKHLGEYLRTYAKNGKEYPSSTYIDKKIFEVLGDRPDETYELDHIIPLRAFDPNDMEHLKLAHTIHNLRWLKDEENNLKLDRIYWNEIEKTQELLKIAEALKLTKYDDGKYANLLFPIVDKQFKRR